MKDFKLNLGKRLSLMSIIAFLVVVLGGSLTLGLAYQIFKPFETFINNYKKNQIIYVIDKVINNEKMFAEKYKFFIFDTDDFFQNVSDKNNFVWNKKTQKTLNQSKENWEGLKKKIYEREAKSLNDLSVFKDSIVNKDFSEIDIDQLKILLLSLSKESKFNLFLQKVNKESFKDSFVNTRVGNLVQNNELTASKDIIRSKDDAIGKVIFMPKYSINGMSNITYKYKDEIIYSLLLDRQLSNKIDSVVNSNLSMIIDIIAFAVIIITILYMFFVRYNVRKKLLTKAVYIKSQLSLAYKLLNQHNESIKDKNEKLLLIKINKIKDKISDGESSNEANLKEQEELKQELYELESSNTLTTLEKELSEAEQIYANYYKIGPYVDASKKVHHYDNECKEVNNKIVNLESKISPLQKESDEIARLNAISTDTVPNSQINAQIIQLENQVKIARNDKKAIYARLLAAYKTFEEIKSPYSAKEIAMYEEHIAKFNYLNKNGGIDAVKDKVSLYKDELEATTTSKKSRLKELDKIIEKTTMEVIKLYEDLELLTSSDNYLNCKDTKVDSSIYESIESIKAEVQSDSVAVSKLKKSIKGLKKELKEVTLNTQKFKELDEGDKKFLQSAKKFFKNLSDKVKDWNTARKAKKAEKQEA